MADKSASTKNNLQPAIAHLAQGFPNLTATFVYREVMALREKGLIIDTFSIWKPDRNEISQEARYLIDTTFYIFPLDWGKFLATQCHFLATRPGQYVKTLFYVLTRPEMKASHRRRVLGQFFYGVYLAAEIERRGIRHVHAHFALNAATVALVISRLLETTFSMIAHANDIFDDPVLLKEKLEQAKFTVTISEYNRKHLLQLCPTAKIYIVPYSLNLQKFSPLVDSVEMDPPVIFSIGRLVEKKGFPYLIQACRILVERGYQFKCDIVGEGPLRPDLEKLISEANLEQVVGLKGAVLQEALLDYWRRATLFVLPCVVGSDGDRDGMPNVLIEAMALQVPVISTTLVGIPEFIRPEYSGLLAPPEDAQTLADLIARMLDDPALRARLKQNARAIAEQTFDLERNMNRLMEIYRENGVIA